jgi:hypothetical protein
LCYYKLLVLSVGTKCVLCSAGNEVNLMAGFFEEIIGGL